MSIAMRLDQLLAGQADAGAFADIIVTGLNLDSRQIRPGDAFIALQGTVENGIRFASSALANGASIVLAEGATCTDKANLEGTLWINGLREKLGPIAARFHGDPSADLRITGVTGTNGKTSVVQLLAQALTTLGHSAATIGTLGSGLYGHLNAGERTTPDAINQQRLLASFLDANATHVAMEVSSHALAQGRVNGIHFDVAVFTNLSRDHLDYHGDMDAYAAAKQRLFEMPGLKSAVINIDDPTGFRMATNLPQAINTFSYAIERFDAGTRASDIETHANGLRFRLINADAEGMIESRLLGRFNVSNLLAVAASLIALGHEFKDVCVALNQLEPVHGRMSRLGGGMQQPLVVVDYAHTPDALEQSLTSLRAHCIGNLICVFGCGGERDVGKRPQMAEIAERLADTVIVTDDNPRGEDGDTIVAGILSGFVRPDGVSIERNRGKAIQSAITDARDNDIILIAGKGHESYQEINDIRHPFDDLDVAQRALGARPC